MPVPSLDWFAQSNAGLRRYPDDLRHRARQLDAESVCEGARRRRPPRPRHLLHPTPTPFTSPHPGRVTIDLEGISDRIVAFPIASAEIEDLRGPARPDRSGTCAAPTARAPIKRYDVMKRKDDVVIPEADGFALTGDGKKLLYRSGPQGGTSWPSPPRNRVTVVNSLANADIRIEPRAEWAQMLDEAWRINRDYFYATNYHGADCSRRRSTRCSCSSLASRRTSSG